MELKPIKLTVFDKVIMKSYEKTAEGLAAFLGDGAEIVLHSLEEFDKSVIKIINGYHSGRTVGSPITDLALDVLLNYRETDEHQKDYICYYNRNKNGETLKSSTIIIKGEENRIIGLLCINYYLSINLHDFLKDFLPKDKNTQENQEMETFVQSSDELIYNSCNKIREQIQKDKNITTNQKNKEIIRHLYQSGIFNIKNSIMEISNILGISKSTTYLHLRNIKAEKNNNDRF